MQLLLSRRASERLGTEAVSLEADLSPREVLASVPMFTGLRSAISKVCFLTRWSYRMLRENYMEGDAADAM